MVRPFRIAIAGLVVASGIALAGCRDGSSQRRGLEIQVSPNAIRAEPASGIVLINYAMTNTAEGDLVASFIPDVQSEQSPGSWTTVVDSLVLYIQSSLGGTSVPRGRSAEQVVARSIGPGRYRLRTSYWQNDSRGITVPGTSREALSNVFTVLP
jgi:hypothetical protein